MKLFYYTATGNSLSIAKSFKGNLISMPIHLNDKDHYEDDVIGFVFPCYTGGIPTIVEDFISSNTFKANYIFAIVTYGMTAVGAEGLFLDLAREKNLNIDYINKIRMVDTSLKYYDMNKQIRGLERKQVNKYLASIKEDVASRKKRSSRNPIMLALSKRGYKSYKDEIGLCDQAFTVEDHCTKCQVCMKVCPVNNITVGDGVFFKGECIRCYACTQNCPQNAIRVDNEKSKRRYRNSDVKLIDIINANHVG
ncbi:4Fe-4S ferredoxin [Acidaminobacter sp. JC074]|uniref:EFR1 family ferrodoxin n=1 Tax=Acidaminobacter sp. JC074 TaxID=2530199 RepID=UPI001F0F6624|nr:EFR1 family ferrodoxin [Acidaminobacter sp. JC074]MCH4886420.1 4Fe-4S ferredoxin [Acidaminobacter sp. JC074]